VKELWKIKHLQKGRSASDTNSIKRKPHKRCPNRRIRSSEKFQKVEREGGTGRPTGCALALMSKTERARNISSSRWASWGKPRRPVKVQTCWGPGKAPCHQGGKKLDIRTKPSADHTSVKEVSAYLKGSRKKRGERGKTVCANQCTT